MLEVEEPNTLLIDTDVASLLENLVALPDKERCFASQSMVYYIDGCSIVVREFERGWLPTSTKRFYLPEGIDSLTVDTVRIVELAEARLLVVGFGGALYCWSLADPSKLLFQTPILPDERIVKLSEAHNSQDRRALLCCQTQQSNFYLIEVRWLDRLSYPKVTPLKEQQSLFQSIGSLPGKVVASLWSKSKLPEQQIQKCVLLAPRSDTVECLVIRGGTVERYAVDLKKEPREAVLSHRSDFLSKLQQVSLDRIKQVEVVLDSHSSPIERLVFYVASTNQQDVLHLTKAVRSMDLSPIINCLDETVRLDVAKLSHVDFFMVSRDWMYLVARLKQYSESVIMRIDQNNLSIRNQGARAGKVVITQHYQLTETGIIDMRLPEARRSSAMPSATPNEQYNESEYIVANKRFLETTPQLTAAISIYTDKYADPTDLLAAISKKDDQLRDHIEQLESKRLDGLVGQVLLEKLKLRLQMLFVGNLRDIHQQVLRQAARESCASKPMKLFENTSGLAPLLEALALSDSWQLYEHVLLSVKNFAEEYRNAYVRINEAVIDTIMPPLRAKARAIKFITDHDRQQLIRLYTTAISLSPHEHLFYQLLLKSGANQQCLKLAMSNLHYPILPELYASPSNIITAQEILAVTRNLSKSEQKSIIVNIARHYLECMSNQLRSKNPSRIKAFEDFPDFNQDIYQAVKQIHPHLAWLLAMKLRKPVHEYRQFMVMPIQHASDPIKKQLLSFVISPSQQTLFNTPRTQFLLQ